MTRTRISIDDFAKVLQDKTAEINKDGVIRNILKDASQVLIDKAKILCTNTDVRNSIEVIERKIYHSVILIGPNYRKGGNLAHLIEYGSGVRKPNNKSKKNNKNLKEYRKVKIGGQWLTMSNTNPFRGVAPKPFMRPAIDQTTKQVQNEIIKQIKNKIEK